MNNIRQKLIVFISIATILVVIIMAALFAFGVIDQSWEAPHLLSSILLQTLLGLLFITTILEHFKKFKKPKKKLKIALDIHGVCDTNPIFFSELSRLFVAHNHEVHVLTGKRVTDGALDELTQLGITYTHFFSIADYHESKGTKMWNDQKGNPWLDGEAWDRTKGDYCKEHGIDFCIDDTERYGNYFETPFAYIKIKKDEKNI